MEITRGTTTSPKNEYLYNKKELQEETGDYDYKFRFYDPNICRFTTIDPKTTTYPWYTPYQFAGNEVHNAIDRDGLKPAYPRSDGSFALARDSQLQRPLTGGEAKQFDAYIKSNVNGVSPAQMVDGFGQNLSTLGTGITGLGYGGAPFTEGGSLVLVPIGEGISTVGSTISGGIGFLIMGIILLIKYL